MLSVSTITSILLLTATFDALVSSLTQASLLVRNPCEVAAAPEQPQEDSLPPHAIMQIGNRRFRHPSSVAQLKFSPDYQCIATISSEHLVVWDAKSGKRLWGNEPLLLRHKATQATSFGYGLDFLEYSLDSSKLYTPYYPGLLKVWSVESGESELLEIRNPMGEKLSIESPFRSIDCSTDGNLLALGSADGVVVCDLDGVEQYRIVNSPKIPFEDIEDGDRLRLQGDYSYAKFSPDGERLAVVKSDEPQAIFVYQATTGELQKRVPLTARAIRMTFTPDGRNIVTTERDMAVRFYSEMGTETWTHQFKTVDDAECFTTDIDVSPDGKRIAVGVRAGSANRVVILEAVNGKEVDSLPEVKTVIFTMQFNRQGTELFYCTSFGAAIQRWDLNKQETVFTEGDIPVSAAADLSGDGKAIGYVDARQTIHYRDLESGKDLATFRVPDVSWSDCLISENSDLLVVGGASDENLHVVAWDLNSMKQVGDWNWPKGPFEYEFITSIAISRDSKRVAAASLYHDCARVWDVESGEELARIDHHNVMGAAFSKSGDELYTTGWDRALRFWDIGSQTETATISFQIAGTDSSDLRGYAVRTSSTGNRIATVHIGGDVKFFDVEEKRFVHGFLGDRRLNYGSFDLSVDGCYVGFADTGGEVHLFDALTGDLVMTLGSHENFVYRVAFGKQDQQLLSSGLDGVLTLWSLAPEEPATASAQELLTDLVSSESKKAYQALWALQEQPEAAMRLIEEKYLTGEVLDDDAVGFVEREIALLLRINTDKSRELLKKIAMTLPNSRIGKLAAENLK